MQKESYPIFKTVFPWQVQEEAARQTSTGTAVSYGKGNPGNVVVSQPNMMPPPIPPQQQVRPQMPTNALSPMGNMGPQVSQINPMGKPNAVMQQQQQQSQQQQQQNRVLPGMEQWNR